MSVDSPLREGTDLYRTNEGEFCKRTKGNTYRKQVYYIGSSKEEKERHIFRFSLPARGHRCVYLGWERLL